MSEAIPLFDPDEPPLIPDEIAILPLFHVVVYPETVVPLAVGQAVSVRLIDEAMAQDGVVGVVALRTEDRRPATITPDDFFYTGTVACIHRLLRLPDATLRVAIQGIERFVIEEITQTEPYIRARIRMVPDMPAANIRETRVLVEGLIDLAADILEALPSPSDELQEQIAAEHDPRRLCYLLAMTLLLRGTLTDRQQLLELPDVTSKLRSLYRLLERERDAARNHTLPDDEPLPDVALPHQVSDMPSDVGDSWLGRALADTGMPPESEQQARRMLSHLLTLPAEHPLVPLLHRAMSWTLRLPWRVRSPRRTDLVQRWFEHADACRELPEAHHELASLLAVRQLLHQQPGARHRILALVGAPGTGKGYLATLLAATYDAPLAPVLPPANADEPSPIVRAIAQAATANPLLCFDETTIGHSVADLLAMLGAPDDAHVFDPMLGIAWHHSPLAIILCVPSRGAIPPALLPHTDLVELPGYSREEKSAILARTLLPRATAAAGLAAGMVSIDAAATAALLDADAAHAGVAHLRATLKRLTRAIALEQIISGAPHPHTVGPEDLRRWHLAQPTVSHTSGVGRCIALVGQHSIPVQAGTHTGTDQIQIIGPQHPVFARVVAMVIGCVGQVVPQARQQHWSVALPLDTDPADAAGLGLALAVACLSALADTPFSAEWAAAGECSPTGVFGPPAALPQVTRAASRHRFAGVLLGGIEQPGAQDNGTQLAHIATTGDLLAWLRAMPAVPVSG